jgi:hypothetical protein
VSVRELLQSRQPHVRFHALPVSVNSDNASWRYQQPSHITLTVSGSNRSHDRTPHGETFVSMMGRVNKLLSAVSSHNNIPSRSCRRCCESGQEATNRNKSRRISALVFSVLITASVHFLPVVASYALTEMTVASTCRSTESQH